MENSEVEGGSCKIPPAAAFQLSQRDQMRIWKWDAERIFLKTLQNVICAFFFSDE